LLNVGNKNVNVRVHLRNVTDKLTFGYDRNRHRAEQKKMNTRLTLYTISYIVYTALLDKNVSINAAQ